MKRKVYITTPIYYVNGNPHVGHAHTSVMGDILKHEYKLKNAEVFFTTGVDEHGQKNATSIQESGLSAQEYLDRQSAIFKRLFDVLDVKYDKFVRTSSPEHVKAVQYVLQKVYDDGLVVEKEYEGLYCVGCEMFKTNADLDENGLCIDHQIKPIKMKETNYFFKLSVYQDWLREYILEHPEWLQPEHYRTEVLHLLDEPLPDLCISRPKSRCPLGIELPFDKDYVAYVWFDALINYISSLGYPEITPELTEFWGNSTHLMAKDIVKTHCIYWPIMLKAIGLEPQTRNLVHGYWTGEGGIKMSKTIGNVVDPYDVVDEFGVEPFRYFLGRTMGDGQASMSNGLIKNCYNSEIVNTISNGVYRTMKLAYKQYGGVYPENITILPDDESFLREVYNEAVEIENQEPSLQEIFERTKKIYLIGKKINVFFDAKAPWSLAKNEDKIGFDSCILTCIESIRILSELLYSIMPQTATKILTSIGIERDWNNYEGIKMRSLNGEEHFEQPEILFQRAE